MLDESEITNAVRARFEALESVPYPKMILRSMPKTFADPDVTPKIQELARLSVRMPDLERIALCEEIFKHVKGLPKTPGRRIFNDAYIEARDKAAGASAEGASAEKKASKRDLRKAKGHVTAADGCLWRETPLGEKERFTNWAPVPTHRVLRLDKADKSKREWIRCVIKGPELAIWATEGNTTRDLIKEHLFPGDVWGSKRKLVDHLPSRLVINGGTDDDVMGIYEMFMRDYDYENLPIIRSTAVLGRQRMPDGTVRYVEACGTIGPDGQWMAEPDLVYIPEGGCSIAHRLPHERPAVDSPEIRATLKTFCENVFQTNDPAKVGAILGWCFGTLFGPELRRALGGGPILNLAATAQSGKSSIMGRVFWPLFMGILGDSPMASNVTEFALIKDLSSLVSGFLCLDELRTDMGAPKLQKLFELLRKLYTGETVSRGTPDLGMRVFALLAYACILGEERIDSDPALVQRCVFVELDGNWLKEHPEAVAAFELLDALPLRDAMPWLHAWSVGVEVGPMLAAARELVDATLVSIARKNVDKRMRSNLTFVAFGLACFDQVAQLVGAADVPIDFGAIAAGIIASANDEDEDDASINPDSRPKTVVDLTRIDYGIMVGLGILKEGIHWAMVNGEERWWFEGCEALRAQWLLSMGRPAAVLKPRAFWRVAREMQRGGASHVVGARVPFAIDGTTVRRVLALDPRRFPATLRLDPLPTNELRSYGGARTPADLLAQWNKGGSKDPGKWGGS